jgi:hypothetical protein
MQYIELIPGNYSEYLLFDLIEGTISRHSKETPLPAKDTYGFNLYKLYAVFKDNLPSVLDLQSLSGLELNKAETIEGLFSPQTSVRFMAAKARVNSHIKSYSVCKIPTSSFSIEELIPSDILDEYYKQKLICIKNYILGHTQNEDIINFYLSRFEQIKSIIKLSNNSIIVDGKKAKLAYQIFGSKNSRLSIKKTSFNIFNIAKDKRSSVRAPEGFSLCQFDFKSFQPRLALSIFGNEDIKKQLRENDDIYSLFEGDREDNKIELISWMFSNRRNDKFDTKLAFIKKVRKVLHEESTHGTVMNFFDRPLFFNEEEENVVFQNYICSVEADCIISLIHDAQKELQGSKSYLAFPFHDCLIFCISDDEIDKINHLKEYIEKYLYNSFDVNFPVSVKVSKSFGSMKDFSLQTR